MGFGPLEKAIELTSNERYVLTETGQRYHIEDVTVVQEKSKPTVGVKRLDREFLAFFNRKK